MRLRTLSHGVIREVGPEEAAALARIADLHVRLLSFGPVAGLGRELTQVVGYQMPLDEGLLRAAIYENGDELGGFISFARDSQSLLGELLRRRGCAVLGHIARSVLRSPARVLRIPRLFLSAITRTPPAPEGIDGLAEITSLAVCPEFVDFQFVRAHRLRVAEELVRYAMDALRAEGATHVRGLIDADNRPVQALYGRLGAKFKDFRQGTRPMLEAVVALK
jgi:ribosomal protein S18 acetylase RimI-like enzyme